VNGDAAASRLAGTRQQVRAYVALGANLGDAAGALQQAVGALGMLAGTSVSAVSGLYRTRPLESAGPDYLNAVVGLVTFLDAPALLAELQRLERQAGRERPYRNAPRTLDLDLLLYGSAHIGSANLTVPHPRLFDRAFVLVPLAEIAPDQVRADQLDAVSHQGVERLGDLKN
jgi:2-amino-4-hydroxy-6-hydroxymethyldihydropteridine diphosphokinase